ACVANRQGEHPDAAVFVAELNAFMASSFEGPIHLNLQLFHLPTKENPQCLESREEQPVETGGKKL
ncbi:MAG TPA: hypothetical protein VHP35_07005, partial [Terriglobia bacterium]|nr:hypothetical protein [Terriglobia bacterium]